MDNHDVVSQLLARAAERGRYGAAVTLETTLGVKNCRAAGADISACQFHRVGSYVPGPQVFTYPSGMSSSPNLPMGNMYQGHGDYSYSPHPKSLLSTRTYPSYSPIGYGDESPTESYGYQPVVTMPGNDIFGGFLGPQEGGRGWSAMKQSAPSTSMYLDDQTPVSYSGLQLPYLNSTPVTRQPTIATDNMSAFSMNSLQSSLASPPAPPQAPLPSNLEHRHLPMPTPARMQAPQANELSQRSQPSSTMSSSHGVNCNPTYTKAAMVWNQDNSAQDSRQGISIPSTSAEMMSAHSLKDPVTSSMQEPTIVGYVPITSSPDHSSNTGSSTVYTPSSLSGATPSSLDEKYVSSANNSSQSSTSRDDGGLPRSDSTTSLSYYCTDSTSKRSNGAGDQASQEGSLVSGQRYAPLQPLPQTHPHPHHSTSIEQMRRDSFEHHRAAPGHRSSASSLNERRY